MGSIVRMTEGQRARMALKIGNKFGKPAKIDGKPEWKKTGNDVATLTVADDGLTATFRALAGSEGTARVQVTADADLGEGIEAIVSESDVIITAAHATAIEIVPDAPEDDPDPAPTPPPA